MPVLPNFFLVGTGKAGTTSLYHYLRQHPEIYLSPIKEPCYFASEICVDNLSQGYLRHLRRMSRGRDGTFGWLVKEWDDYLGLFRSVRNETAVGEASVAYLWSESAAGQIASRVPDAKIVMILRDPSERAFSQYAHQLATGLTRSTFHEHLQKCVSNRNRELSIYHPFLEVGLYHEQVLRYLRCFPRHNLRIYWYEDAWKEPHRFMSDLFEFLDVDPAFGPDLSRKSLERRAPRFATLNHMAKRFEAVHRLGELVPAAMRRSMRRLMFRPSQELKMDPEDRRFLVDYYREDITRLGELLDRDLSGWLA